MLTYLTPNEALREWGAISACLKPAVARCSKDMAAVLDKVAAGEWDVFSIPGGYVVTSTGYPKGSAEKTAWVVLAAGNLSGGVKARLTYMRALLGEVEAVARHAKCKEMRVEGRPAWARVLTDYEAIGMAGANTVFRKVF